MLLLALAAAAVALLLFGAFGPQGDELVVTMGGERAMPAAVLRWAVVRALASPLRPLARRLPASLRPAGADGRGGRPSVAGVRAVMLGVSVDDALAAGLDAMRGSDGAAASAAAATAASARAADAGDAKAGPPRSSPPLPLMYWAVWAGPAVMWCLTHRAVPFSVLGGVHMSSRVRQVASRLPRRGLFDVEVELTGEEPHRRGTVVVVRIVVRWRREPGAGAGAAASLWEAEHRMLFFHGGGGGGKRGPAPAGAGAGAGEADGAWSPAEERPMSLPSDTGRRWAALCGDYNPIHVSAATARLFGFRSAIAHGMCVTDRALPGLLRDLGADDAHASAGALHGAGTLEVAFRRPVPLPSSPVARSGPAGAARRSVRFEVHAGAAGSPSITGSLALTAA